MNPKAAYKEVIRVVTRDDESDQEVFDRDSSNLLYLLSFNINLGVSWDGSIT